MIETYAIGVMLALKDNISGDVSKIAIRFERCLIKL